VVAAASAGPRALVGDGADGLLVPVDDAAALAGALRRLIDDADLRVGLARAGRARYEAAFTEVAVVRQYRAFFEKVCG
jgi:glycosyltransferase involved in cell wall biosynthesis